MGFLGFFDNNRLFGTKFNGESFFVNSYGNDQTRGVYTFKIDVDTGKLHFKTYFKTPTDPTYSFNYGRFVCTTYKNRTGTTGDGGICSYTSTADTLALVSRISDNGKTYVHACTNGDDKTANKVFGVDYYNGQIMVGSIVKKKLTRVLSVYTLEGKSIDPIRQNVPHPHYVGFTPELDKLYVVDLGLDKVLLFDVSEDGTLVLDEMHSFDLTPGTGPRQMTFSKDGKYAYVVGELTNTIHVYQYQDHTFTLVQTVDTYDKEEYPDETSVAGEMTFLENGDYLFVTNRGHDSVTCFKVDLETGKLSYRDFADTSPNPRAIHVFKDRWLVVGCQKGGIIEVVEFSKEKDGLLFDRDYSYAINEPVCITKFVDITDRK